MALDPDTFDALIDTVRRFVAERLRPLEADVEAADAIPDPVVAVVVVVLAALAVGLVLPRLRRSRRDDAAQDGADVRPAGPA